MVNVPQAYSVLDASAMIAFLQGEPGAEVVESVLKDMKKKKSRPWSQYVRDVLSLLAPK